MWHLIVVATAVLGLLVGGVLGFWQGKYRERKKHQGMMNPQQQVAQKNLK